MQFPSGTSRCPGREPSGFARRIPGRLRLSPPLTQVVPEHVLLPATVNLGGAAENPGSDEVDELAESVKQPSTDIIGQEGRTTTEVSGAPGLVTIDSQLFPAIAMNNQVIPAGSEVAVIGVFTDGLIVEPLTSVESPSFGWLLGGSMTALAAIAAVVFAALRTRQKNAAPKPEPTEASK